MSLRISVYLKSFVKETSRIFYYLSYYIVCTLDCLYNDRVFLEEDEFIKTPSGM